MWNKHFPPVEQMYESRFDGSFPGQHFLVVLPLHNDPA
jgi:hypothetical protein